MPPKAKVPPKEQVVVNTYGCPTKGLPQWAYDSWAFAHRLSIDKGAPTRPELFKRLAEHWLPGHFEWHAWTDRLVNVLCDNQGKQTHLVAMPGCSGAGKTFGVLSFAAIWWLAAPTISSVTIVSTTKQSLRKRGWAEVQRIWSKLNGKYAGIEAGNFVDSRMMWQATKGDDKQAITGRAVEEGSTLKVADDIKGVHTTRQMVIIDEATAIPDAIWDAMNNLCGYPKEFIVVTMANPRNYIQRFARFMEPKGGWNSVTIETEEWEGKPQNELNGGIPMVVRFDAEKSPNITEGRLISKHLPTREKVEAAQKNGGANTPNYWTNMRGFPPPEGLNKTVFSMSAFEAAGGYGGIVFSGKNFFIIGFLDPAFGGGDLAMLRFAKMGMTTAGEWSLELLPPKSIPIDANSKNPVHFQIAEQVQRECESIKHEGMTYSCLPENFGLDSTGEGGGLADIFSRIWSPKINRVEFGAAPSESQVSHEDVRMAGDVYRNRRAEMYFRTRQALDSGQLKGFDRPTAEELSTIEFDDSKPKIVLIAKSDYRIKYGKSPDLSDCACGIVEVARRKGFTFAAIGHTKTLTGQDDQEASKAMELYHEENSFQPEEIVEDAAVL